VSAAASAPASASRAAAAARYGYVVAGVLAVVYTFNFLDRQFLTVLQEDVKRDLHLSDAQLGALTGLMFALFYTSCGIPIAALADRWNRVRIVTLASATWSLFTAACGFAGSFVSLAAARVCVGVGEAGGSPPSYSILSDYFPRERRGRALAIYSLGVPLGSMFGTMCGGFIAQAFGWRAAFWTLGIVGLLLTPLIPILVKEPLRGAQDAAAGPPTGSAPEVEASMFRAIGVFTRSPVLMLTAVAAGLTAFVGYGMLNWNASLLIRVKHATKADVALWYALFTGVANVAGTFASGLIVDRWGRRNPAAYALAPGIAILLSVPFLWGAALAPSWPVTVAFLVGPGLLNNMYLAPALAVVQNGVPTRHRGTAGALLLFVLNLIGLGGGPFFVGLVSDALRPRLGAAAALQNAMLWLTPFFVLAFGCQLAAAAALRRQAAKA
jgi:MFS family permease